ncbi:hypothetical protein [Paenibacillus soyae]|uniref:Uncharacterized protein n=1 Tax=Paenibacillus soyae TaxID=2969249 RepID=A0A9X2MQC8_9BACL|nr:hypothetical protein [Paenibacillus soyae]MCR2804317.1 hypothetical protein [Paenibacillus soyae]
MAGDTLKEREGRLKLERGQQDAPSGEGGAANAEAAEPLGPPHANEHWKALYARISEVTAALRR